MASGRVQLASTGIQDTYLTGDPQFTYFLKQYKRHTKFALETLDNSVDGYVDFGASLTCFVPRKGDLIHAVHLRIELSNLYSPSQPTANIGYTDSIGNAIVDYIDLVIGGQTIQRITGEYMELYSDLFIGSSQQPALQYLIGRTLSYNGLGKASTSRLLLVPLPFYFLGNDSLNIPLSVIEKQDIQFRIKLKPLSQLIVNVSNPSRAMRGHTDAVEIKLTHYFSSPSPWIPSWVTAGGLAGNRMYAVDSDTALVYNLADEQKGGGFVAAQWKLSTQYKATLSSGYDVYETRDYGTGNRYTYSGANVFLGVTAQW